MQFRRARPTGAASRRSGRRPCTGTARARWGHNQQIVRRSAPICVALVAALAPLSAGCGRKPPAERPSIVLIVDRHPARRPPAGLRLLEDRDAPPRALAADRLLFENAYSHVPLTLPAHASLFTGLLPAEHGLRDNLGYRLDSERHATLAGRLRRGDTRRAAACLGLGAPRGHRHGPGLRLLGGLGRGPGRGRRGGRVQRPGGETLDLLLPWLDRAQGRPFFLFFHIYEPHSPFEPARALQEPLRRPLRRRGVRRRRHRGTAARRAGPPRALRPGRRGPRSPTTARGWATTARSFTASCSTARCCTCPCAQAAGPGSEPASGCRTRSSSIDVMPTLLEGRRRRRCRGAEGPLAARAARGPAVYAETYYPRVHLGWSELPR